MCSHFKTQLILSCIGRPFVFHDVRTHRTEWTWCAGSHGENKTGYSQIGMDLVSWVSQNGADHRVRTKKGTQRSEWTWCAGVSQNGDDNMVRTKMKTHGSKWTWCAGVSWNGGGHMVRT